MDQGEKHIGIVTNSAWNIFNFRMDLIKALREDGYIPVVFAPNDRFSGLIEAEGVNYFPLKKLDRDSTNPFKDIKLMFELIRLFKKTRLDQVLLYTIKPNIYGSLAAKWSGVRSIATVTGLGYSFLTKRSTAFFAKKLYTLAFRFTNKVVFHNPDDLQLFAENKWVSKAKSLVIPGSGVDMKRFSPSNTIRNTEKSVRFLFIGRLLYDKGVLELLQAFEKLNGEFEQTELWLVGEIDKKNPSVFSEKDLKKWLGSLKTLSYKGLVEDVRPFISESDVVVLPSYREGIPKTILEAMSMAKPVIVADVPGCRETIVTEEPVNGYFCRVKDTESLYLQMKKMVILSDEERQKMGLISKKIIENRFEKGKIIEAYLDLVRKNTINK